MSYVNFSFLNPAQRAKKFACQLKTNTLITNEGVVKKGPNGSIMQPSARGKSFMQGYLTARSDNSKAYNSKKKRK